jgi:hypothetical protein
MLMDQIVYRGFGGEPLWLIVKRKGNDYQKIIVSSKELT